LTYIDLLVLEYALEMYIDMSSKDIDKDLNKTDTFAYKYIFIIRYLSFCKDQLPALFIYNTVAVSK